MKLALLIIISVFLFASGCSTVKVVPEQVANGSVNLADNSQTITHQGTEISVRVDQ